MTEKKSYEKPMLITLSEKQTGTGNCEGGNSDVDNCLDAGNLAQSACTYPGGDASGYCESTGAHFED